MSSSIGSFAGLQDKVSQLELVQSLFMALNVSRSDSRVRIEWAVPSHVCLFVTDRHVVKTVFASRKSSSHLSPTRQTLPRCIAMVLHSCALGMQIVWIDSLFHDSSFILSFNKAAQLNKLWHPGSHFQLVAAVNVLIHLLDGGGSCFCLQTLFSLKKLFLSPQDSFLKMCVIAPCNQWKQEVPSSLPTYPHPSCVSPPAGFNIHTSFVFWFSVREITRVTPPPPSPSLPGLAVWWRSPALQPDSGRLAEPAEAEVQGRGRLLRGRPLCGRTGQVSSESRLCQSDRKDVNLSSVTFIADVPVGQLLETE